MSSFKISECKASFRRHSMLPAAAPLDGMQYLKLPESVRTVHQPFLMFRHPKSSIPRHRDTLGAFHHLRMQAPEFPNRAATLHEQILRSLRELREITKRFGCLRPQATHPPETKPNIAPVLPCGL